MNTKDWLYKLFVLLLVILIGCIGMYHLPDVLWGQKIKKVDLFSDIRNTAKDISLDSLRIQLERTELVQIDSTAMHDSVIQAGLMNAKTLAVRDSLYKVIANSQGADSEGIKIEDYSVGHTGLSRFFSALNRREQMDRPVRIAVMGDSFIEGDIMVADFRNEMQQRFGGNGVGFVPVRSVADQYRPTIHMDPEGWNSYNILSNKKYTYTLPCMLFEAKSDEANISFKTTERYQTIKSVNSLKFIYEKNEGTVMRLTYNHSPDTIVQELPPSSGINQYVLNDDNITEGLFTFTNAKGFRALGMALEDNQGVVVDNFSLRGNSGLSLVKFDPDYSASFEKIRRYDLIVLQYGLNVVSDSLLQYGWYRVRLVEAIKHIRHCFPDTDILLLSLSDRANQYNGKFSTMPAVLALLHAQRQAAKLAGVPFWNMFGAMGGENSMVTYVEKGWASKDYTHMSFRGGKEIAKSLMKALMLEKEFYDKAEEANK